MDGGRAVGQRARLQRTVLRHSGHGGLACADHRRCPAGRKGVKTIPLDTSKRADNTTQVTCNDHPVHHYAGDATAGDTNGEDPSQSGAARYVLSASGNQLESD